MSENVALANETIGAPPHPGMTWIPGDTFRMGSEDFYPEEKPVHEVRVDSFWMDCHEVTNHEFAEFVNATGMEYTYIAFARQQVAVRITSIGTGN